MKNISCADLGVKTCDFHASGKTDKDIKTKIYAHAKKVHPDMVKNMTKHEMKQMDQKIDTLLAG